MHARARCLPALLLLATLPLFAPGLSLQAQKKKAAPAPAATTDSDAGPWSEPQPAGEKLDLTKYQKIRD